MNTSTRQSIITRFVESLTTKELKTLLKVARKYNPDKDLVNNLVLKLALQSLKWAEKTALKNSTKIAMKMAVKEALAP